MSLSLADKELNNLNEDKVTLELKKIKKDFIEIQHLDLSNNNLKFADDLKTFSNLKTLIIDNNYFYSLEEFPKLNYLETFSANKNQFSNLNIFLEIFSKKFPNALHISLLKNPLCPFFTSEEDYEKYRNRIIAKLPKITNIDGIEVKKEKSVVNKNDKDERKEELIEEK